MLFFGLAGASGCAAGTPGMEGPGGGGGATMAGPGGGEGAGRATGGDGGAGATDAPGGTGGAPQAATTSTATPASTSTGPACPDPQDVAGYEPEAEPNAIAAQATPLAEGAQGFSASLCPPGDIDVLAIPIVTPGTSLRLEIKDPAGGCPPGASTYLRLFDPNGVLLAKDGNSGEGQCSLLSPERNGALQSLPAGTYHAQVENISFVKVGSYVLDVSLGAPACGDGVLQGPAGEQCDDGNQVPGDGCAADCSLEAECGDGVAHFAAGEQCDDGNVAPGDGCSAACALEAALVGESEPNTQSTPDSLLGFEGAIGSIVPGSDTDWYAFEVTVPGSNVTILASDGLGGCPSGADTKIALYTAAGALLAEDDDDGPDQCSLVAPASDAGAMGLAAGSYVVEVEDVGHDDPIEMYVLTVTVAEPGCGDGLLQPGEQCDDGNTVSGDGCANLCQAEPPWEIEPNSTSGTATPQWPGYGAWNASIQPAGDADWFGFTVQAGQSVTLSVHAIGDAASCPAGFDSVMSLLDAAGAQVVDDDDDGVELCSAIDPALDPEVAGLPAGTYHVRVEPFAGLGIVTQYQLDLLVQ